MSNPELRQFYTQLLSISNQNLLETSYPELQKIFGLNSISISSKLSQLKRIRVIEAYINAKAYCASDNRLIIGFANDLIVDSLFKSGGKK